MDKKSQPKPPGAQLKFVGAALGLIMMLLAIARMFWKAPRPFLMLSGGILLACLLLFAFSTRKQDWTALKSLGMFALFGVAFNFFVIHGLYHWDHAGWIWYKLTGLNSTWTSDFPGAAGRSFVSFVSEYPMFELDQERPGVLLLKEGEYHVRETIIVPEAEALIIEPGVTIRFHCGQSLISYSPVYARGTEASPIVFEAETAWRKWGTFGVVTDRESILEHVIVENGRHARVDQIDFFGAISFIRSKVRISNCEFRDLYGRDGVYVGYGQVQIENNLFQNCFKDGLDLDGGSGLISHNNFINCRDEGIDLSENFGVEVIGNVIRDSKGGRIAAENNLDRIISQNTLQHLEAGD